MIIQTNKRSFSFTLSITILFILFTLSSCTQTPQKSNLTEVYQKLNNLRNQYTNQNQYYYGIGTGTTPEEAVQNARIDLANQILTLVQKKTTQKLQVTQEQTGKKISNQYQHQQSVQTATFSALELENTKIIQQQQQNHIYYAVVGADANTIAKIKAKAQRTVAALVVINQLQESQKIEEKLKLLNQGIQAMQRFQIQNETLLFNNERYTFKAWFDQTLQQTLQQIKVAVTKDNEVYAIYFLEAQTLSPITGIKVQINQFEGYTDALGRIVVANLSKTNPIKLTIHQKPYLIHTFIKGSSHSTLHVYTQPKGFVAELKEDNKTIASITTPESIPIEVNPNSHYTLIIHGKEQYPEIQKKLSLSPGFDNFFYKKLEKMTYGSVILKVSDEEDELTLTSPKGQQLYIGTGTYQNSKLQVGTYKVQIQKPKYDPEYQIIEDQFVLAKDQTIKRIYSSPADRQFYRRGGIWSFGFVIGGSPNENAQYTSGGNTFTGKQLNYNPTSTALTLSYRYFNNYTFLGGGIGLIGSDDSEHKNTRLAETKLQGVPLSIMGGLYKDLDGSLLLLEGGYRKLTLSQTTNSYYELETDISSPFIGLHYFFKFFQVGVRYFTEKNSTVAFNISLGSSQLDTGYKLPERVQAKPSTHYLVK